eukprot:CAMPEP_0206050074 /NCGR_PEP_ID=MMETSP1466-20131121/28318_1 /ASSEMBLY_ACC=CAM_ASM_001126 /TAXON_ID=44452 /ORGANISM="Pavlova gyrans, Strain CCMP608" /LENGTH=93 /DNA_ID=CAMNT_0053425179 /DNA_START=42 /DNA_END=320 /DNA_ORIENTATION=-
MPLRDLLALRREDGLRAHQDLLSEGLVREYDGKGFLIFVSHQWVGLDAPDPDFSQFQVLQDALRNLASGSFEVAGHPQVQILGQPPRRAGRDW